MTRLANAWWVFATIVAIVVLLTIAYAAVRFLPNRAVAYDNIEDHFKYGSTGGEVNLGFPFWIWQAMPLLCADLLPGDRLAADYRARVARPPRGTRPADLRALSREGYKALGLIYETNADGQEKDLPIGVSMRRNLGLDRVFVNCAVCHASTVRDKPDGPRRVVLGMPANLFDLHAFENFFFSCARDERFNKHNVIPSVQALGAELDIAERRGPASVARTLYEDLTPPEPPRPAVPAAPWRERGSGRPTKRDRRQWERLR